MRIAAIVVTFNRFELLKKTLEHLRAITRVDKIIVINNGSTDGTTEWLRLQTDLHVVHQENVGGSGGFYTGIRLAHEEGFDWLWCMDDDVFPEDECLEKLLACDAPGVGILCPRRIQAGKVFVSECIRINLSNPFASLLQEKLSPRVTEPTDIQSMVFEGPLIKREVVDRIGYPNKDLFIFYDDTDYSYRTVLAGFRVVYVPEARMQKELFFAHDNCMARSRKKKWKHLYQVRNAAYFNHCYGKNRFVRYVRAFQNMSGYLLLAFFSAPFVNAYRWSDLPRFWKMYWDGIHGRLGKL